jgi:hypothetical protein
MVIAAGSYERREVANNEPDGQGLGMSKSERRAARSPVRYDDACDVLERALRSSLRQDFVSGLLRGRDFPAALKRLRSAMQNHRFKTSAGSLELAELVETFDERARAEGFEVLKEWDQVAARSSRDDVPVLMLDYFALKSADVHRRPRALAVLLDYYFLYVLALVVMRAWDEGDANRNLDRITSLLQDLRGPMGSGQQLVEDAATLLFIATSNFQPDETAYPRLLEKVWTLDERHRLAVARVGGPMLGTHLRWALTAIYERDLVRMREDNGIDYPWLFFSGMTLMREYARLREEGANGVERSHVTDALLNAMSADPWAFVGPSPAALARYEDEYAELRELLAKHEVDLLADLEAHAPADDAYSPVSLQFNFPHNALVSIVVLALLATLPLPNLPLDALLREPPRGGALEKDTDLLARAVTGYAAAHPEKRGDRRVLIDAYNPPLGLRSYTWTMSALKKRGEKGQPNLLS